MKKIVLFVLLMQTMFLVAEKPKPNPADYTVKVHLVSSATRTSWEGVVNETDQFIEVIIDGQPMELKSTGIGILALGDYSAKASKQTSRSNTYDLILSYEFLMPDGKTRTYTVTRLGSAVGTH